MVRTFLMIVMSFGIVAVATVVAYLSLEVKDYVKRRKRQRK